MENGMLLLFRLSLLASIMALAVLATRFILRRAPKVYTYVLWIFVFIRAVLPISYASSFSLSGMLQNLLTRNRLQEAPVYTGATASFAPIFKAHSAGMPAGPALMTESAKAASTGGAALPNIWMLLSAVWITGVFAMLFYSLISIYRLKKNVRFAILTDKDAGTAGCRVYRSGRIQTAFILGFFRPAIYLPSGLTAEQTRMILEHETVHIRRHDHHIKFAAWIILTLHWFNPLMWASFWFLGRDMELSCDEQVLINLGTQIRVDYSTALLDLASPKHLPSGVPLAFSEGSVKHRIQNILHYRPMKHGSAIAAFLLICITLYGCMGSPKDPAASVPENTERTDTAAAAQEEESQAALPNPQTDAEIAFVQEFVSAMRNEKFEDVYAMLSPALKERADRFDSDLGIRLYEKDWHIRINPFPSAGSPVIEKTQTGYRYRITRPEDMPKSEYDKFHMEDVWEGHLVLQDTEQGNGLEVADWSDTAYNEITSYEEYLWYREYFGIPNETVSAYELEWAQTHSEADDPEFYALHKDPVSYILENMHLKDGEITETKDSDDKMKKQITYTWKDGSATFRMEQLSGNGLWYMTGKE